MPASAASLPTIRDQRLIQDFLIPGYQMTTLSSVTPEKRPQVLEAKLCLGLFITLMDDLADRPDMYNPELLRKLEKIVPEEKFHAHLTLDLGQRLINDLFQHLEGLPNFQLLRPLLEFDLAQIKLANHFSEMLTLYPHLGNLSESRELGSYNMGMVAAGIIDLMGSPAFKKTELGDMREILRLGQRMGRIGNLISTMKREQLEGDRTSEIIIAQQSRRYTAKEYQFELKRELNRIYYELILYPLHSFCLNRYATGVLKLYHLHLDLEGVI